MSRYILHHETDSQEDEKHNHTHVFFSLDKKMYTPKGKQSFFWTSPRQTFNVEYFQPVLVGKCDHETAALHFQLLQCGHFLPLPTGSDFLIRKRDIIYSHQLVTDGLSLISQTAKISDIFIHYMKAQGGCHYQTKFLLQVLLTKSKTNPFGFTQIYFSITL